MLSRPEIEACEATPAGGGQIQRLRGARGFLAVVRGVAAVMRRGHAPQIGRVPDQILGRGQDARRLRAEPVGTGRAGADDIDAAGRH